MKRKITVLIMLLWNVCTVVTAQDVVNDSLGGQKDSLEFVNKELENPYNLTAKDSLFLEYLDTYSSQLREPEYRLYPTKNNWTFLLLNTRTGQIWQVQYSVDKSPRMKYVLDDDIRIYEWHEDICGRFILQETVNYYNFILLDQIDGRCWQVQWNIDEEDRFVIRIR